VASVETQDGQVKVVASQRSNVMSNLRNMAASIKAVFELAGAEVNQGDGYPAWKMNANSELTKITVEAYKKLFNKDPKVLGIHAGLECGLFLEKFPDLDMISFGPTLRGVHAPGEKLELASLDRFVKLLDDIVCNFK
jgi:dipeptidase D